MVRLRNRIKQFLPAKLMVFIRPIYKRLRLVFAGLRPDKPSSITIGSFGGLEIAYRKNTADKAVIGYSIGKDIFFSEMPEFQPEDGHVIIDNGAHIGTF